MNTCIAIDVINVIDDSDSNFRNNMKKKKPFAIGRGIFHFSLSRQSCRTESLLLYISSHPFQQRTILHMHDLGNDF